MQVGGGLTPFSRPSPLQGSNVRQPERVWKGLGRGLWGYPHMYNMYNMYNNPHDALIILRCASWGDFQKNHRPGRLAARFPSHLQVNDCMYI